ncbi:MAG: hypothetical protein M3010_09895 [Candidatus Dormibacteraeota bacterium]|nr:hypothetical protein [Candidatus Dormibacteraeota bacterium]
MAGVYGIVTALSRRTGVSRQTLYTWRAHGQAALLAACTPAPPVPASPPLARAILTLWAAGHASYRGIQAALPALGYDAVSLGTITAVCAEAQTRALAWFATAAPPTPRSLALDEIYGGTRNHGYCSVIDVHSSALWVASGQLPVDTDTWTLVLWQAQEQGLRWSDFVSDGGAAIHAACGAVAPTIPHQRDVWHVLHRCAQTQARLDRYLNSLEAQATRAAQYATRRAAGERPRGRVPQVPALLPGARQTATAFHYLSGDLHDLLGMVVLRQGRLLDRAARLAEWAAGQALLRELTAQAPAAMQAELRAVLTYLTDAVPAALVFTAALEAIQAAAAGGLGAAGLGLVAWAWQRRAVLAPQGEDWLGDLPVAWQPLARRVVAAWETVPRASSAVENWHSLLRPHLAVHRELGAGLLALLGVWHNHRVFARGAHRGQSPLHLSGLREAPVDWLVALGYPPVVGNGLHLVAGTNRPPAPPLPLRLAAAA